MPCTEFRFRAKGCVNLVRVAHYYKVVLKRGFGHPQNSIEMAQLNVLLGYNRNIENEINQK